MLSIIPGVAGPLGTGNCWEELSDLHNLSMNLDLWCECEVQELPSSLHLSTLPPPPAHVKAWGPVICLKRMQFPYWTNYFVPSCGFKFILFWSAFCVYKSFKFICFRCCGNCVVNWIPKCLSWFQSHDKELEHLRVGVRTQAGEEGINIPHSSTDS